MIIEKNGKKYNVSECSAKWVVKMNCGKLSVSYDIPKDLCLSEHELWDYIMTSDMF